MNIKCRLFLFFFILVFKSVGQLYPYIEIGNSGSDLGIGLKLGRISPFVGFDWSAYVSKNYDIESDTFKNESSDFGIKPLIGLDVHLIEKTVNLYTGFQMQSSFWVAQDDFKWYLGFLIGMGIEKRFKFGLALSGEYNISYSVTKYEWEHSEENNYWHYFRSTPRISIKYYITRKN